jgi:large subunit ribosomal protein L4
VSPEKKRTDKDAEAKAAEQAAGEPAAGEDSTEASVPQAEVDEAAAAATEGAAADKPKRARARAAKAGAADDVAPAVAPDATPDAAKPKARKRRAATRKPTPAPEAGAAEAGPVTEQAPSPVAEEVTEAVAEEVAEPVAEEVTEAAAPPEPPKVTRAKAAKAKAKKPHVERHAVEKPAPGRAAIIDGDGNEVEAVELGERLFGVSASVDVLHLVVRAEQAARRRGTASTKTRGEVSGSTAKLYRQKGTGRARVGSAKSPTRTHGGIAFGPKPRDYDIKVNRKVRRKALAMALSDRAAGGDIYVARDLVLDVPSTGRANDFLAGLDIPVPVLVVTDDEPVVTKSVRNLHYAEPADVRTLSTEQVLRARSLVLTAKAFAVLNEA